MPFFACFLTCEVLRFTSGVTPAKGQHGSGAFSIHVLADVSTGIGGVSGQGSNPRPSVWRAQRI